MHLILFLVGIVLAFAGAVLIHSSVPVADIPEAARFNSGIIAVVGGLILMALAVVVRSVGRIAERFDMQPLPLPPVAAVGRDDPAPRAARPGAPNGEAAKRPSLLSWFGSANTPANGAKPPAAAPEAPAAPQVDLAPLARVPEEPRVAMPPAAAPPVAAPPPPKPPAPPLRPPVKPAAPAATTPDATVYKSGVIDGMAYTLFMDGSIEAELPHGKVRFASVDELQKYLTTRP
jgi:hypothetical protein